MRNQDAALRCHVCKTFKGEAAKALDELVNKRGLFPSYAAAVVHAVLDYHRRLLRDDLEISKLRAISGVEYSEDT